MANVVMASVIIQIVVAPMKLAEKHIFKRSIFYPKPSAIMAFYQDSVLVTVSHFCPSLAFESKGGVYPNWSLLALPSNIRLGLRWLSVTNTLAY
jgi:hypothetical protein